MREEGESTTKVLIIAETAGPDNRRFDSSSPRDTRRSPSRGAGDARDAAAVDRAVPGQDAVLSAFGPRSLKKDDLQGGMMGHLTGAMKAHGVRRLVNLSSWALTPACLDFVTRNVMIPLLARQVMADKERGEAIVFASNLDDVNIRPGRLLNAPGRGGVRASKDGDGLKQVITRPGSYCVHDSPASG